MNINKSKDKINSKALEKIIYIWFYKDDDLPKLITKKEISKSKRLSKIRKKRFYFSRGSARLALSELLSMHPLEVPLIANPGEPPILEKGLGHISFSHCNDMLVVAWCMKRVGIDIEREDRKISNIKNFKKLFLYELNSLNPKVNDGKELRSQILDMWVIKESLIKWEKSSIFGGMQNWKLFNNYNYAINSKSSLKVKIQKIDFYDWKIGVASNHSRNSKPLQVCI